MIAERESRLEPVGPHVAAELARLRRIRLTRDLAEAALRLATASVELLRELEEAA